MTILPTIPQNRLLLKWKRHLAFLICLNLHWPLLGICPGFVFNGLQRYQRRSTCALAVPMEMFHIFSASRVLLIAAKANHPDSRFNYDGCIAFLGFLTLANLAKVTGHHLAGRRRSLIQLYFRMNFCAFGWPSYTVLQRQCHLVCIGVKFEKIQNKQNGLEGWLSGRKCLLFKHKDQSSDPQSHLELGGRWGQYLRLSSSLYTNVSPLTHRCKSFSRMHTRQTHKNDKKRL